MIFMIVALALFAGSMTAEVDAETEAEQLAEMFSPILILTEETGGKWGDIIVTKPEPVNIMGAQSAENLHFIASSSLTEAKLREFDSCFELGSPDATADVATRRSHKVLYLHSGAEFTDDHTEDSLLLQRDDVRTTATPAPNPQNRAQGGFRYVAAERHGAKASQAEKDSRNHFTGIAIHVHEIGHLLGLGGAGTPALNFEARTVTQPVALAQAGPEGESGRNRSVERETQATAEGDSVQVETGEVEKEPVYLGHRIRGLGGSKHAAVRIPTKVLSGTLFFVAIAGISGNLHYNYIRSRDEDEWGDGWGEGLESVLFGLFVGSTVGFPAGVTAIDPDDSLPSTLLAGVIPGAAGLYLLESQANLAAGFGLLLVSCPPFSSLAASELLRNSSEDPHTSLGITPIPKGGLSAVATLRF
ncbi:MAG: hypothetical protein OXG13_12925 [Gemmatimonadaceae bacterium]|nr:hypothetical protein [Gemmatimonadaceae bacterium]